MTQTRDRGEVIDRYRASFALPAIAYAATFAFALGAHTLIHTQWSALLPAAVAALAIASFLENLQHAWVLTSEQIIANTGILVRDTQVIRLDRITDMRVRAPLLSSLLGTGAVQISTAGSDGYELTIFRQHRADKIEAQIAKAKREHLARQPKNAPA